MMIIFSYFLNLIFCKKKQCKYYPFIFYVFSLLLLFLYQTVTVILQKKKGHILYIIIYTYIYSYMKNFFW